MNGSMNATGFENLTLTNVTTAATNIQPVDELVVDEADDAIWILTSTFIIFTMQSGFGLLESGSVTTKNEVNIMFKNCADVVFGGLTYWIFGYAFSFGTDERFNNWFCGWGYFFAISDESEVGKVNSHFFFQASFATTATTIVSGAMAERTKLEAYILFSTLNTIVYSLPAHWVWDQKGWLASLGMVDIAGAGPVHLVGGVTGLVATILLKPRYGRYGSKNPPPMGSPTNAILGMFMLWWGWLGFNCGSTFGISGYKWKLAARSAVSTLVASIAGGTVSCLVSYFFKNRKFDVAYMINGILGSLVGITASCALTHPWESFVIGTVGAFIAIGGVEFLDKLKVDDPVGCIGVHGIGSVWSLLAVGLFARKDSLRPAIGINHNHYGVFYGGGWYLLGVQCLGIVSIIVWTVITSLIILKLLDLTIGLRVPLQQEILGADLVEHAVGDIEYDKKTNTVIGLRRCTDCSSDLDLDEESMPKFNEARKRKRRTSDIAALKAAQAIMHKRQWRSGNSRHDTDPSSKYYSSLWKFAVGKTLNEEQKTKRKTARNYLSIISTKHKQYSMPNGRIEDNSNSVKRSDSFQICRVLPWSTKSLDKRHKPNTREGNCDGIENGKIQNGRTHNQDYAYQNSSFQEDIIEEDTSLSSNGSRKMLDNNVDFKPDTCSLQGDIQTHHYGNEAPTSNYRNNATISVCTELAYRDVYSTYL